MLHIHSSWVTRLQAAGVLVRPVNETSENFTVEIILGSAKIFKVMIFEDKCPKSLLLPVNAY